MPADEDPKAVARAELRRPETQRLLRQFLNLDGPKGVTDEYRRSWNRMFGKRTGEHGGQLLEHQEEPPVLCDDEHCWCRQPQEETK